MNKAKLKTYAPQARKDFIAAVTARANLLGISEQNGQLEIAPGEKTGDLVLIAGQAWPAKVHDQRERLIQRMRKEGFAQTLEAVAYTWFNRFAALRFMEIHDYLGHGYRVLSSREGGLPEILTHATELAGVLPGLNAQQIADMKLAGNQDGELYRLLLVAQCNALSNAMPFLFERIDDESELLLPGNLERTDSVVAKLVEAIPEEDWSEVEVIGWLYQFYISEKKDEVIGKVVKSEDIPAATQLFTPNWIVQYLVQNSVGRLWLMANPASSLKSQWPYYIEPAEQTPEVQAQLDALIRERVASDQWPVARGGAENGGEALSGTDRLAEGDGLGHSGVSTNAAVSPGRTLWVDQPDSSGSGFDTFQHSGGTSPAVDGGVSQLSLDSSGVPGGTGNPNTHRGQSELSRIDANRRGHVPVDGSIEDVSRTQGQTNHWSLTTSHYVLDPESITVLDPACGSGHILVEAYEVLKGIYLERGYQARSIPRLILEKNLYGLDIDDRAAQLAGFALLMKARADDRRLLESPVKLNVLSLQESRGVASDQWPVISNDASLATSYSSLITTFEHAKTFGSLIQIPKVLEDGLADLEVAIAKAIEDGDVFARAAAQELVPLVQQAKILAMKFDAVVANPPYMGSNFYCLVLKDFVNRYYNAGKADLYGAFVLRNVQLVKPGGYVGMITIPNWMFLSSFAHLRKVIFENSPVSSLVHNGRGVWGSDFGSCSFVLQRSVPVTLSGTFLRLFDKQGSVSSNDELELRFHANPRFTTPNADFEKIPGTPFAYWTSNTFRRAFTFPQLRSIAVTREGMVTGNNDLYLRFWHEVSHTNISQDSVDALTGYRSGKRWFPYIKGGGYRKWSGNRDFVVDWQNDGHRIRETIDQSTGKVRGSKFNLDYIFRPNVSWSALNASYFGARLSNGCSLFDSTGPACFPNAEYLHIVNGLLNSVVAFELLKIINPTVRFLPGDIGNIPIAKLNDAEKERIKQLSEQAVSISDADDFQSEISSSFSTFPMVSLSARDISAAWSDWSNVIDIRISQLLDIESENNRLFIKAYGLQDELSPEVSKDQITLTRADREKDSQRLISYAIGCMMGRYSLDEPGLIYAHAGNAGFDATRYKTFPADADGIIPITDELWFEDDAANRIREFLLAIWPAETLEENLAWLAESLGIKGNEMPTETIRRYLASSFFKDHLQTYKKRPIYWLFSSGKQGAFQALVYLHRYHEGTLARMRAEYVVPLTGKMQSRIEMLEKDKDAATSTAARNKIAKQIESLKKKHVELLAYDEKLRHYADMRISLDLDDGVKVNYGKFGDLLAEVKAVTGGSGDE